MEQIIFILLMLLAGTCIAALLWMITTLGVYGLVCWNNMIKRWLRNAERQARRTA